MSIFICVICVYMYRKTKGNMQKPGLRGIDNPGWTDQKEGFLVNDVQNVDRTEYVS